jgi:hypothetical protein
VISFSDPPSLAPRMEPSWALHTAVGLFVARLHTTTHPSASPVTSRLLDRMNEVEWIWAAWPRRMYAGWAGGKDMSYKKSYCRSWDKRCYAASEDEGNVG